MGGISHTGAPTCVHGFTGYCSLCTPPLVAVPQPALLPMGCICPPGANKECENPICPRKGYSISVGPNMALAGSGW